MNKLMVRILIVAVVGVIALVAYRFSRNTYEVVNPKTGDLKEAVYGLGKVKSVHRYDVKLGVTATVKQVFVREGQSVKQSEKLIELDEGVAFRAPFHGTVTRIAAYVGETALPQTTLLRLEDLEDRFIEVPLEQEAALRVRPGQVARVSFESMRGEVFSGKVTELYPKDEEFFANVAVNGLSESVLPGMSADVSVEIGAITGATLVPLKAIHNGMIIVRRNGRREKVKVEIGHVDGLWAEIKGAALNLSDEILVPKAER